ncbi:hypothetical protein EBZ80_27160, partial [bacterium]|nr:hypothetical protein [bacterium]
MNLEWTFYDWAHGDWDVLSDTSDTSEELEVLAPAVADDNAQDEDDTDAFAPCHFWAMNVWRRQDGYRSAYSFPRAGPANVAANATTGCMLTLLNRKNADGAVITFAS